MIGGSFQEFTETILFGFAVGKLRKGIDDATKTFQKKNTSSSGKTDMELQAGWKGHFGQSGGELRNCYAQQGILSSRPIQVHCAVLPTFDG